MDKDAIAQEFQRYASRLYHLAESRLHPLLHRRLSIEDVLQETLYLCMQKKEFFARSPDIPLYFKFRLLLFQTITLLERTHLQAQKRDIYKEIYLADPVQLSNEKVVDILNLLPATTSTPLSKVARLDRHALLINTMRTLPKIDYEVLVLRHFDGCTNQEVATILGLSEKAASIRYVRALDRLHQKLLSLSEFID